MDSKLGELLDKESGQRDAIHVAIAPVTANEELNPGDHIGFVGPDNDLVGIVQHPIGVVDPFLRRTVYLGQRFFMLLYPQTVTSLRHEWTHPAFEPNARTATPPEKQASEEWLRAYARNIRPYDKTPYEAWQGFLRDINDGYLMHLGYDCHSWGEVDEPEELLAHLSIYLGRVIRKDDLTPTCSC